VELGGRDVLVGAQVVLDSGKVHGLFHYLCIVRNAQGYGIHRLTEGPRRFTIFQKG
jgi:hypothetical protein